MPSDKSKWNTHSRIPVLDLPLVMIRASKSSASVQLDVKLVGIGARSVDVHTVVVVGVAWNYKCVKFQRSQCSLDPCCLSKITNLGQLQKSVIIAHKGSWLDEDATASADSELLHHCHNFLCSFCSCSQQLDVFYMMTRSCRSHLYSPSYHHNQQLHPLLSRLCQDFLPAE